MTLKKIMTVVIRAAQNGASTARLRKVWNRLLADCRLQFRASQQWERAVNKADLADIDGSWPQDIIEFCQRRFNTTLLPDTASAYSGMYDECGNTVRCAPNWSILAHEMGHALHILKYRQIPRYRGALYRHAARYATTYYSHRLMETCGARYSVTAAKILREILPTNLALQNQINQLYLDSLDWKALLNFSGVTIGSTQDTQTTTASKLMRKFLDVCFAVSRENSCRQCAEKQPELVRGGAWFSP